MNLNIDKLISESTFKTARSGGSGGQNVNKLETKVILFFNVEASQHLTPKQKEMILENLKGRINKEGILQIQSDSQRTQFLNKKATIQTFELLIKKACKKRKRRIATSAPPKSIAKRLDNKRHLSEKKQRRRRIFDE